MKLLVRTLIILAAAGLISGITFAVAGSSYAQALFPAGPRRGEFAGARPPEAASGATADGTSSATPRAGEVGREGGGRPGGFAAVELLKNLAIVAVIVALAAPIQRLARRRTKPIANRQPVAAAPTD